MSLIKAELVKAIEIIVLLLFYIWVFYVLNKVWNMTCWTWNSWLSCAIWNFSIISWQITIMLIWLITWIILYFKGWNKYQDILFWIHLGFNMGLVAMLISYLLAIIYLY